MDSASVTEESVRLTAPAAYELQVEFVARRRSPDTKVYQVSAFTYWGDLLDDKPRLYEYSGPRYLIYNERIDCVKAVMQVDSPYITGQCSEPNFYDNRLASWKILGGEEPSIDQSQTQVIEVWPYVLVYFYPGHISFANKTMDCPSYPFKLNAMNGKETAKRNRHERWFTC